MLSLFLWRMHIFEKLKHIICFTKHTTKLNHRVQITYAVEFTKTKQFTVDKENAIRTTEIEVMRDKHVNKIFINQVRQCYTDINHSGVRAFGLIPQLNLFHQRGKRLFLLFLFFSLFTRDVGSTHSDR